MKVSELLKEDWGTSDWRPLMQSIKKAIVDGISLEDAARYQAERFYKDLGYDDVDDAVDRIIYMFKLRNIKEARMETKGNWKIQNLSGVMKNFKSAEDPAAKAWMKTQSDGKVVFDKSINKWVVDPKIQDREDKKAEREQAKRDREDAEPSRKVAREKALDNIYANVTVAISNSFPDGDPWDHFGGWLTRNDYTMDDVDEAFKKYEKKGYNDYLEIYWDETARDAIHDANEVIKAGQKPNRSPFYDIINGDSVKLEPNPWRTR